MAEAIAALAFAGSIVQFLEFGTKFALKAGEILKAGSSSISDLQELRHITHHLEPLLQQLNTADSSNKNSTKTLSQSRLEKLSKECSEVVQELLQTLDRAGVNNKDGRWDAIVTSFRLTWQQGKIEKLNERIDKFRGQLAVELLISIRDHSSQSLQTQEAILQQLKNDSHYRPPKPRDEGSQGPVEDLGDAPGSIMLQFIRSRLGSGTSNFQMKKTEDAIHQLLFRQEGTLDDGNNIGQNQPIIRMKLSRREKIESRMISGLRYSQIGDRETSISEAYKKTFEWMFKDSSPDRKDTKFREWLESDGSLYWITGKAGSGKSTLMKYLSNFDGTSEGSTRCKEHLEKWAGGTDHLTAASFYFWASGSSIEASQRGLFQSLLFQILMVHPDLLPKIVPKTWEAWSSFGLTMSIEMEKTLDEILLAAIRELVEQRGEKVCLFVDGLDEYLGDHEKLIAVFQSFLLLPNVKMCVSSRPWIVFEDSFNTAPSLMVQEFTYPDIEHYVTSRFNENDGFARLQKREADYAKNLMTSITVKASGVFLWVKLVVTSLLTGMTNDDRISDLQRRLSFLPPELGKLYDAILKNLDPFYLDHAMQYFQLLEASKNSPDALLYSFIDEESLDFALKLPIQAFEETEIKLRRDTVKRRLNSRCKGLLEVSRQGKIRYLHQSVKEYIDTTDIRSKIDETGKKDFDCHLQLCSANLAMVKILCKYDAHNTGQINDRILCAKECLLMAAKVKRDVSKMIQILDDLDRTLKGIPDPSYLVSFYQSRPDANLSSPLNAFPVRIRTTRGHHFGASFMATTVRFSVVDYVRARAKTDCVDEDNNSDRDNRITLADSGVDSVSAWFQRLRQKSKFLISSESKKSNIRRSGTWPLLIDANFCDPISPPMFQCLLELGADPNLICNYKRVTPWTETLTHMMNWHDSDSDENITRAWEQWVPILSTFLEHGAQRDDPVYKLAWFRSTLSDRQPPRISVDHISIALECLARGRADLGLEYLLGKQNIAMFKWDKRNPKPPPRNHRAF